MPRSLPPFSRLLPVHDLPARGRSFEIGANPQERAALAELFGILEVVRLTAEGWIWPEAAGRRVRLDGRLTARVVQTCVVTLEPVTADIDAPLERLYGFDVRDESSDPEGGEVHLALSDDLPAEPLHGGLLDLGAAAAEQLSLELDPYPRAEGAVFAGIGDDAATSISEDGEGRLSQPSPGGAGPTPRRPR